MDDRRPKRIVSMDGSVARLGRSGRKDDRRLGNAHDVGGLSRRELLAGVSAAVAVSLVPQAAKADPATDQPPLSACASALSVLPGGSLNFYFPVTAAFRAPLSMEIRKVDGLGPGGLEVTPHLASISITPEPTPVAPAADVYATGCSGLPAHPVSIPATWESGLYVALFRDSATPTANVTNFAFVVRRPNSSTKPEVLLVLPLATLYAYNYWGGASLYAGPPGFTYSFNCGHSNSYIHAWDGLAAAHFSHQVALDRPGANWQEGTSATGFGLHGYPVDYGDFVGSIRFLNDALGASQIDYATSVDLHTDTGLLPGYNLMVSIGHDEYWSREMRNNVENWVKYYAGNACFLGANTCWWQVRFERRSSDGTLLQANDPTKMVCYKQDGQPVGQVGYDYSKDPLYCEAGADRSRLTTHWHTPFVNRPENSMTGVSYRNGAYYSGGTAAYNVNYPKHWAFARPQLFDANGQPYTAGIAFSLNQQFGNTPMFGLGATNPPTLFDVSPEWDAADLTRDAQKRPYTTGNDGSPLNFLPLASCECNEGAVNPYANTPPGFATMGLFRNNGVIFHCGILGWRYGLFTGWKTNPTNPSGDVATSQITWNVLQRLRKRGPWKFEAELHNAYFEQWMGTTLKDWVVTGPGSISKGAITPPTGNHSLDVNAMVGQMTITQEHSILPPLQLERYTSYRLGIVAKAPNPGDVQIYLMSTGGHIFAQSTNTLSNAWQTLMATGQMNLEGPMFEAYVVIVIKGGTTAQLSNPAVWEVPTAARFGTTPYSI